MRRQSFGCQKERWDGERVVRREFGFAVCDGGEKMGRRGGLNGWVPISGAKVLFDKG